MLAYLLAYPDIAAEFLEELAEWDISEPKVRPVFSETLSLMAETPDLQSDELKELLKNAGYAEIFKTIAAETEILSKKRASPREIEDDIRKRLSLLKRKSAEAELKRLAEEISAANDEEAALLWERYRELLKAQAPLA